MANTPQYVERLIDDRNKRANEGLYNSSENLLLYWFKIAPGCGVNGSFDFQKYIDW
jgi:hypothetical protein